MQPLPPGLPPWPPGKAPRPPPPAPPPPPHSPITIPAGPAGVGGIAIISGAAKNYPDPTEDTPGLLTCLFVGDEGVTKLDPPNPQMEYQTFAAQCCTAGSGVEGANPQEVCRRRPNSQGEPCYNNRECCVAGDGGDPPIEEFTYPEVVMFCDHLGLELCEIACAGQGCDYDKYPVWTGLPCPYSGPFPPPPSIPPIDYPITPPSPPPSPPPPLAPIAIPATGVALLNGEGTAENVNEDVLQCVWPGDEDATSNVGIDPALGPLPGVEFQLFAAQCCTTEAPAKPEGCRRSPTSSGGVGGNEDCVAGRSDTGDIKPFNYKDVFYFCWNLGLTLCQQTCHGKGCNYDK